MREEQAPAGQRLSVTEAVGYGVGDMAANLYLGFFGLFTLYFLTDVYGIAPAAAATMLLLTKIIDAITDPVVGMLADRTRSRWGRYRPYLLWGALPYGLTAILVFAGPDLSDNGKLLYAYVVYSLAMLGYTLVNVPYSALLAVISPSEKERTRAAQYRFVFAGLGTLVIGATARPLVDWLGAGDEARGFLWASIIFAIAAVMLTLVTFATTRERAVPQDAPSASVREDLRALLGNASWVVLTIGGVLLVVGLGTRLGSLALYLKYFMTDAPGAAGGAVFLWMDRFSVFITLGVIGQIFGTLAAPALTRRLGKIRLMIGVNAVHGALLIAGFALTRDQFLPALALHGLGMMTFGVALTILFSMFTDCVQFGEWQIGRNTAGLTVASSLFILKLGSGLGAAIPGYILALSGFAANAQQSAEALTGLRIITTIAPGVLLLTAAGLMTRYRLDRAMLSRIEQDLAAIRRERASALSDPPRSGHPASNDSSSHPASPQDTA
jgi:GPH family glycoside/pentoside/hexuronide:cation symporter